MQLCLITGHGLKIINKVRAMVMPFSSSFFSLSLLPHPPSREEVWLTDRQTDRKTDIFIWSLIQEMVRRLQFPNKYKLQTASY